MQVLLFLFLVFGEKCEAQLAIDASFYDGEEDYYTATTDDVPYNYEFDEAQTATLDVFNKTTGFATKPATTILLTILPATHLPKTIKTQTKLLSTSASTPPSNEKTLSINRVYYEGL